MGCHPTSEVSRVVHTMSSRTHSPSRSMARQFDRHVGDGARETDWAFCLAPAGTEVIAFDVVIVVMIAALSTRPCFYALKGEMRCVVS